MTHIHADDDRVRSLLDWHADLIAHGKLEEAAAMADRLAAGPVDASLFSIADSLAVALAPVSPEPGFRTHLRGVLETHEAEHLGSDESERSRQRRWPDLVPRSVAAIKARASGMRNERRAAASHSTRRIVSSVAAASVVGLAAAWWVARALRRSYIPSQPAPAGTDSSGQA